MRASRAALYQAADLIVASEIPLPAYARVDQGDPAWTIRVAAASWTGQRPEPAHIWFQEPGHRPWLWFTVVDHAYHLCLPDIADVVVSEARYEIVCYPAHGRITDDVMIAMQNQILPLAIGLREWVLHVSAVVGDGATVLFAGAAGSGKSTLAAFMGRHGWRVLTDDASILKAPWDAPRVAALGAGIRLRKDSLESVLALSTAEVPKLSDRAAKFVVAVDAVPNDPVPPVRVIYLLDDPDEPHPLEPRIDKVNVVDATLYLLKCSFLLKVDDPLALREMFHRITSVVAGVRVSRLRVPVSYDALPRVAGLIEEDLRRP